eukprot:TRINITY_DN3350_c0_g2_i3.p7 TRINITY_DN3350_c0_g2~~TRINITY_DN3350_c0_g2_i3.p7  ORF type:complete len:136 (-),score=2.64 TRINITY_DN3350_c0_g2_i3:967-1374(-)
MTLEIKCTICGSCVNRYPISFLNIAIGIQHKEVKIKDIITVIKPTFLASLGFLLPKLLPTSIVATLPILQGKVLLTACAIAITLACAATQSVPISAIICIQIVAEICKLDSKSPPATPSLKYFAKFDIFRAAFQA